MPHVPCGDAKCTLWAALPRGSLAFESCRLCIGLVPGQLTGAETPLGRGMVEVARLCGAAATHSRSMGAPLVWAASRVCDRICGAG
eukprot:358534-Chlamydomonas_euryale.AAC.3